KRWQIRPSNSSKMEPIDQKKLPLGPADLQCAENLLKLPYIAKWTDCMRLAWAGHAPQDCLKELAERAQQEPPEVRKKLQSNLGSRLQVLAPRNREWSDLLFADNPPEPVRAALASYRQVEQEKVAAALQFQPGHIADSAGKDVVFTLVPETAKP